MKDMVVTLEVSKLSGWLNADASCRDSKGGHAVGARCTGGHRREAGGRSRCKQRLGQGSIADLEQGAGRSAR